MPNNTGRIIRDKRMECRIFRPSSSSKVCGTLAVGCFTMEGLDCDAKCVAMLFHANLPGQAVLVCVKSFIKPAMGFDVHLKFQQIDAVVECGALKSDTAVAKCRIAITAITFVQVIEV